VISGPDLICHSPFFVVVPRLPDFSLDIAHIVKVVEQEKPKCIFLTSPNNPDGRYVVDTQKGW
jgi:histidinol-phosphate aminotransferase